MKPVRTLLLLLVGFGLLATACEKEGSHLNKAQFEKRQKQKEGKEGR